MKTTNLRIPVKLYDGNATIGHFIKSFSLQIAETTIGITNFVTFTEENFMMIVRPLYIISLTVLSVYLLSSSCKNRSMKEINQGEIHFNITYSGPPGSLGPAVLPRNMVVTFKQDKILFDIKAIGNNGITNLTDPSKDIYDTYLSLLGMKSSYAGTPDEIPPGLSLMEGMVIEETDQIGDIIGFKCHHARVTFPAKPDTVFDIWYTNEINIDHPNSANPFREIDGVLLNFFFFIGERTFNFEAESIYRKEVPDKAFERRVKFNPISKEQMDTYIIHLVK